ncbi:MAG: IS66 family transposase, partial [Chloroflexota bacterium]|nr:IS66 family transposase [Chloroflexota bacterium]
MTAEEIIEALEAQLKQALERLTEVTKQLQVAQARIEELERLKTPPPAFVKANKPKAPEEQKKVRKKRDAKHNRARARSQPTQVVEHRLVKCPSCELRLGGITLARVREVIDIPPLAPVEVTHHRIYKGWCASCERWHEAPVDLHEQVVGHGRIGVRLSSLIATLRTVMRLPIRQIRELLHTLHGFEVSIGEIVEILHRIKEHAQPVLDDLKRAIRASSAVQADETGWREDGENGSIWSVSTPKVRYYEYHHSRAGEVIKRLIGDEFAGVLGSDFYAGYNIHQGLHQRCWVHFLRDIHDLKKLHPDDAQLWRWAKELKQIYQRAKAARPPDPQLPITKQHAQRVALQHAFEQELWQVCAPFVRTQTLMHTLCERVERFLPELFVFLAYPGVPSDNNLAERSVRPLVIARKVSGGTRSPKGSSTRMGLASLFGTW